MTVDSQDKANIAILTREQDFRARIDVHFERFFDIEREVYSVQKKRIDYVLRCKESKGLFGVEVKHTDHMTGINIGNFLIQASAYSNMDWRTSFADHPTKLLIFIAPAISNTIKQVVASSVEVVRPNPHNPESWYENYRVCHPSWHQHSNVNSLIGAFGVGEIRRLGSLFYFIRNNLIIWNSSPTRRLRTSTYKKYMAKIQTP